jgi:hypothetical protein
MDGLLLHSEFLLPVPLGPSTTSFRYQQQPHRIRADVHEADDPAVGQCRLRRHSHPPLRGSVQDNRTTFALPHFGHFIIDQKCSQGIQIQQAKI